MTMPSGSPVTRSVTKCECIRTIATRKAPQWASCFRARTVRSAECERTTWTIAMIANSTVVSCQNGTLRIG